jgi:hypothetical protein
MEKGEVNRDRVSGYYLDFVPEQFCSLHLHTSLSTQRKFNVDAIFAMLEVYPNTTLLKRAR